ncbi:MAG: outer membrane protein assembly factor BamA [Elusimicrobia bacterium]|nr:outer membrane protein assembly factor BamA [Elusimicrobiota bacterium]
MKKLFTPPPLLVRPAIDGANPQNGGFFSTLFKIPKRGGGVILLCLLTIISLGILSAQDDSQTTDTAPQEKSSFDDNFLPIPDLPNDLDEEKNDISNNDVNPESQEKAPEEQIIKTIESQETPPDNQIVDTVEKDEASAPDMEVNLPEGPWIIKELAVKGNINIKSKVIIKTSKTKKNETYYKDDINADIERILGLGSIENVSIDISPITDELLFSDIKDTLNYKHPVRLTFMVKEKLMITDILVKGNEKLSAASIKRTMNLAKKDFFDELKAREDIIAITDKYHTKGFIDATTDYEIKIDTAANTCQLSIIVKEGEKSKITDVSIPNVKSFELKKVLKKMKNRPKKVYAPLDLADDLKKIEIFYKNSGFNNFKINSSSVVFNENKSEVFIKIDIEEGLKFTFGDTSFTGNSAYTTKDLQELLEYKKDKFYSDERLQETLRAIQNKYADKGYLRALIKPLKIENKDTGALDINFQIEENSQIYVDHIDVEGNKATKTYVLRREIAQKEGAIFSSSKIRRSQEKIFNLGFIDDVQLAINPSSSPDKVDLVFDIAEGKPGMLTAGAGVSSNEGLVGTLSAQHLNMFGRAQKLSISWQFGARMQDYHVSWTTPWIKDKPISLGGDVYNTRRYRPYMNSLSAYTEKRTGGKISLGPRFEDDKYRLNTSYTFENVKISGVKDEYKTVLTEGTSATSSIYVEFARDTRNNIWDPVSGSRSSIGLELTGGPLRGDVNFYKPNISFSYNHKLFEIDDYPFVLSFANRFGYVARFGSTKSVPVYERYFIGGSETVRGYNSNGQIGPLNGGKVYSVANVEFKFPLARERKRTIVQWAFFFDVGNSWEDFNNVSIRFGTGTTRLKAGADFGIRFTTPAFPIRLDWAYGFNHEPGEQRSDIYFTLGNLF